MNTAEERLAVGRRAGVLGILANTLLCAGKLAVGALFSSTALLADGMNNLTDAAGSAVTLIGFKLSAKPADRRHPYGHARSEYLAALFVCVLILFIGAELLRASVLQILSPTCPVLTPLAICVPAASILIKSGMYAYYRHSAKRTASKALRAAAADCLGDVLATTVVLLCLLLEPITSLHLDGIGGLLVSLFILANGVFLAKDTLSTLLGEGANPELEKELVSFICRFDEVTGCHDLLVHDYGPMRRYVSVHVETAHNVDAFLYHETIDKMERECLLRFGIHLTVHHDPMHFDDPELMRLRELTLSVLQARDERIEIHDFRLQRTEASKTLYFDAVLPEELLGQADRLQTALEGALSQFDNPPITLQVTFHL